jgi:effector-binding domain-containing protein
MVNKQECRISSGGGCMPMDDLSISHKQVESRLVAYIRFNLKERADIQTTLQELAQEVPAGGIDRAPYVHIQYFSSYT